MTHPPCLRLRPAYPGNPRNRIEGESPQLRKGHTVFASLATTKGKRNADRRIWFSLLRATRASVTTRTRFGRGSPDGVPPRLSPGGSRPFRSAPGQASWDAVAIAFARRALPAPTCPSPGKAPPAPAVIPESMMPEAARERTVSFRARAPHSLRFREYPRPKASLDERDSSYVPVSGTFVKT
jgi:hypothetical protein